MAFIVISDAVWNTLITAGAGVLTTAVGAFFLYMTRRINRVQDTLDIVSKNVDGLSSRREAELVIVKVDRAAAEGKLKGIAEAKAEEKAEEKAAPEKPKG